VNHNGCANVLSDMRDELPTVAVIH